MNVLARDPKTVCVKASEMHRMDQLDKLGFEVVPTALGNTYAFGGGCPQCREFARRRITVPCGICHIQCGANVPTLSHARKCGG